MLPGGGKNMRRGCAKSTFILISFLLAAATVSAQDFPVRPIRVIVPSAPGGGYDFIGRLLADRLPKELGQTVVVENRAGAGTLLGTQVAAAATPDGYTLVIGGLANMAFNPGLYKKPGYSPITDFTPIALMGSFSYLLVARSSLPQSSAQDLIQFARANPGKLTMAAGGTGSGQHVAGVLLARLGKIDLVTIQYKGAQPAYVDLLAGRIDLFFDNTTTALPYVKAGRVKPLLVSGQRREPLLPEVPTGKEAGLEGLLLESWIGPFAPAKTPRTRVERLRQAVQGIMQAPDLRSRMEASGWRILSIPPKEAEEFVKSEAQKWPAFLREAGVKAD
jgi:tripartite-type tricarboxylate transporter receptor subunit TctC